MLLWGLFAECSFSPFGFVSGIQLVLPMSSSVGLGFVERRWEGAGNILDFLSFLVPLLWFLISTFLGAI